MKNSTNYGQIVKKARKDKGYTQEELGKLIGVGKTCICNYETEYCEMSVKTLDDIANALGYSLVGMITRFGESNETDLERKLIQAGKDIAVPFITSDDVRYSLENLDKFMDSYLTMPSFMVPCGKVICIKAKDDALKNDGICKNDYVFVTMEKDVKEKSVVMFVNKKTGDYYIRRYIRDGHIVSMMPSVLATDFSPIRFDERDSDYEIVGTCVRILTGI